MKPTTAIRAIALLTLSAGAASAHATFEQKEVVQGATSKFTLLVPHGCNGEPTLKVRIALPEGLISVKPMPKVGWQLETVTGEYEGSYEDHGTPVTEGVREIIWTGELPDAFYDEFVFRANVTDSIEAGEMLYIPAIQECASGTERWIEIPAEGQDAHDLDMPAPGVMVVPASQTH